MVLIEKTLEKIRQFDEKASDAARKRQDILTKPRGSFGRLEELSIRLAGITGCERPKVGDGIVFIMAADHGVSMSGVSAYPREVTAQMVLNFLAGGAVINVMSRYSDCRVVVTDCGVDGNLLPVKDRYCFHSRKIALSTGDISKGSAMTVEQAKKSIAVGIEVFEEEYSKRPFDIAAMGDMGIGNTTPSAAIVAVLAGISPQEATGRGTGIDDKAFELKTRIVEKALNINKPNPEDGIDVLSKIGGFEIGAIAGAIFASAARRIPIVVDGFISTAGALVAQAIEPHCVDFMISAHRSAEAGHEAALDKLGLVPLFDLGLRLGEGTGAVLAMALCDAACRVLDETATFEEAGVSNKVTF